VNITESEQFMRASNSSHGGGPAGGGGTHLLFEDEPSAMLVKTWQMIEDSPNFRGDPLNALLLIFFQYFFYYRF